MALKYVVPGPQHSQTPTGAQRYVTSGEMPAGAGTGDAIKAGYNLWTGPSNVWNTPVTFSGVALFGGGLFSGSVTGANRLVTSGELTTGSAGTGDATRTTPNYFTALNIFNAQTTLSGAAHHVGPVAISGGLVAYTPLLDNAGRRFLVSGEGGSSSGTGDATRTSPNYFAALNVFAAQTTTSGVTHHVGPVAVSGGLVSYTPMQDGAGRRFLVSGEVVPGTGDFVKAQANYVGGSPEVFVTLSVSGALIAGGGTQISGAFTTYAPLLTHAGQRFVTSGELVVIPSGITTINDQTGPAITFATAFTGTDFAVSAAGNVVTFTLPNASPFSRGKITLGAQTFSGVKGFADSIIALGGVQISGTSIAYAGIYAGQVGAAARYITSGELTTGGATSPGSPADSVQFNNAGSFGGDAALTWQASADLLTVSGRTMLIGGAWATSSFDSGARYVTSGELTAAGTGDFVKANPNYIGGSPQVFAGVVAISGSIQLGGGTQVSGVALAYGPLWQRTAGVAAQRYVVSGELVVIPSGLTTLNSQTGPAVSIALGSAGNDFALTAAGNVVTLDLPSATQFARGAVTTTAQTISGVKTFVDNVAVRGATQLSGLALHYAPAHQGTVAAATRYVTSGELVLIPSGLTTLNSQTGPAVVIAAGSTGNDVNIAAAANVVTVHVPDASAFARGVLTTGAQTISGAKRLADSAVMLATTQASGVLLTYAGAYAGSVGGATRYITSGELSAAGTGDATRTNQNYFSALNVFGGTLAASGSLVTGGGTQISGALLAYAPLHQRIATGAQRYLVSGEMVLIPSGITTINALTGPAITVTAGNLGSDFNINPGSNIIQINLPDAGLTTRGAVTVVEQEFNGLKIFNAGAVVRGDTLLSGVTLSLNGGLYGGAIGGATRYVTSGELAPPSAGSGDVIKAQDNYFTGAQQVFASTATVAISGTLGVRNAAGVGTRLSAVPDVIFGTYWFFTGSGIVGGPVKYTANAIYEGATAFTLGGVQISGGLLAYSPLYSREVVGTQRYLPSGEIGGGSVVRVINTDANSIDLTTANTMVQVYNYTVPANTLISGQQLFLELLGHIQNTGGAGRNFSVISQFGGVTVYSGEAAGVANLSRGPLMFALNLSATHSLNQHAMGSWTMSVSSTSAMMLSGIVNPNTTTDVTRLAALVNTNVDATQSQSLIVWFRNNGAGAFMQRRIAKLTYFP